MYTNAKQPDVELNLLEVLRFMRTRRIAVLAAALLCAVLGVWMPVTTTSGAWEASGSLMLYADGLPSTEGVSPTEEKNKLTHVAQALLSGPRVCAAALEHMGGEMTAAELAQYVTVSTKTQLIVVTVKHSDPVLTRQTAEAILAVAPSVVADALPVVQLRPFATVEVTGTSGTTGSRTVNAVLGGAVGAVLGALTVMLLELLNTTVKSRRELAQLTDAPVLGVIPTVRSGERESARAIRHAGRG